VVKVHKGFFFDFCRCLGARVCALFAGGDETVVEQLVGDDP
jgi:hypothetical protein